MKFVVLTASYKPLLSVKLVIWSLSMELLISSMNFGNKNAFSAASTNESVSAANFHLTALFIFLDAQINGLLFPTLLARNTMNPPSLLISNKFLKLASSNTAKGRFA